jgi:heme/copper-type cytochrome/quinol oxidase subunit 2
MPGKLISGAAIAVLAVAMVMSGYGAAIAIGGAGSTVTSTVTSTKISTTYDTPYVVTLVVATGSVFNKTAGDQPAFLVLGPNGLVSSGQINIPAHRLIKLVIVNYDNGNASLRSPVQAKVSGTSDGSIFVASNDNINSSQAAAGIVVKGGAQVSSVSFSQIAHTFSIPTLGLNIPIPVTSTVVAYFTVDKAGTFLWYCFTACGDAAMATSGWMTGSMVAS